MQTFWFYLEPYTFLWVRKERALVYNTLTQKGFELRNRGRVKNIVVQLTDPQNMYCVKISADDIEDPRVNSCIKMIRKSFSGDLIETSLLKKKPFIFVPFLNLQDDVKRLREISNRPFGADILTYLGRVDFYVNGSCNNKCLHCYHTLKQMPFCFISKRELSISAINNFLHQIRGTSIKFINILGGNIFSYKYFEELIDELDRLSVIKTFYLHYLNLPVSLRS